MLYDRHFVFFLDDSYDFSSSEVEKAFHMINQPGALFSLFYVGKPMHWIYLAEPLPLPTLCLLPFTDLDLPVTRELPEILESLEQLHESLELDHTLLYWFAKEPIEANKRQFPLLEWVLNIT